MQPVPPSWFKQRQAKTEPAGDNILRLTGPNLGEAFICIRQGENNRWSAGLRLTADGSDVAATGPDFTKPSDAWDAAFELYRLHVVVGAGASQAPTAG
jgi:hypothetical protein